MHSADTNDEIAKPARVGVSTAAGGCCEEQDADQPAEGYSEPMLLLWYLRTYHTLQVFREQLRVQICQLWTAELPGMDGARASCWRGRKISFVHEIACTDHYVIMIKRQPLRRIFCSGICTMRCANQLYCCYAGVWHSSRCLLVWRGPVGAPYAGASHGSTTHERPGLCSRVMPEVHGMNQLFVIRQVPLGVRLPTPTAQDVKPPAARPAQGELPEQSYRLQLLSASVPDLA